PRQIRREPLERWVGTRIRQTQAPSQGGGHAGRIANDGEIDETDPVSEGVAESDSRLARPAGLANARRTYKGERPGRAANQQLLDQLQLLRASQERHQVCPVPA